MKTFIVLGLLSLTSMAQAKTTWKPSFETENCTEHAKIFTSSTENHVLLEHAGQKVKLASAQKQNFKMDSKEPVTYKNGGYEFIQPSVVENNLPKLNMIKDGQPIHCSLKVVKTL